MSAKQTSDRPVDKSKPRVPHKKPHAADPVASPPVAVPSVLTLTNGTKTTASIALCFGPPDDGIIGKKPWKIVELKPDETVAVAPPLKFEVTVAWSPRDNKVQVDSTIKATVGKNVVKITEAAGTGDEPLSQTLEGVDRIVVEYAPLLNVTATLKDGDGNILDATDILAPPVQTFDVSNNYQMAVVNASAEVGQPLEKAQVTPIAFYMTAGQTALLTGPFSDAPPGHYTFDVTRTP